MKFQSKIFSVSILRNGQKMHCDKVFDKYWKLMVGSWLHLSRDKYSRNSRVCFGIWSLILWLTDDIIIRYLFLDKFRKKVIVSDFSHDAYINYRSFRDHIELETLILNKIHLILNKIFFV